MHWIIITGSLALAMLALPGCQTQEELTAQALIHHQELCQKIGFQDNTAEMRNCVLKLEATRRDGRRALYRTHYGSTWR